MVAHERTATVYPVAITRAGVPGRPRRCELLANGCWRVDWISGLVTTYDRDPRGHLALGYEPARMH